MHYRSIRTLSIATLLTLLTPALGVASTPNGYNAASMSLSASGVSAQEVSFDIPSTSLTIDSKYVHPGSTFTVTIPISNTTDRAIDVTVTPTQDGTASTSLSISGNSTATIAANSSADIVFTFAFAEDMGNNEAGQALNVTFDVQAIGTYESDSGNQTF